MSARVFEAERLTIMHGDAAAIDLPDASVDLIVTSPPYFGLRSYQDNGEHYAGQVGSEATPAEFVAALLACTREWVRVLKPSGSMWINLGDKYAGSRMDGSSGWATAPLDHDTDKKRLTRLADSQGVLNTRTSVPTKSLIGIPWRYALACIDQLGLILRAEVIWAKPNGLPESVTDRIRRSHEQWFHFTVRPRYFSAVDEIREEHAPVSIKRMAAGFNGNSGFTSMAGRLDGSGIEGNGSGGSVAANPLGKLPGSVWTVPTQPLQVPPELGIDHFAAFPMEWPRRIIRGWSPSGVCVECGEGRRPVATADYVVTQADIGATSKRLDPAQGNNFADRKWDRALRSTTITGYACACPEPIAPTTPAVVLDPFGGTGTTALVAWALGRHGISNDLSRDYCRLAEWRCTDPGQRAAALQVEKPPVQVEGQMDLLEVLP